MAPIRRRTANESTRTKPKRINKPKSKHGLCRVLCKMFAYYVLFLGALFLVLYLYGMDLITWWFTEAEVHLKWWQKSVIYQIYPRSFQDSNGDGVGDLNGITNRLDYLVQLGIGAIWISPFFKSPMVDFGYDISNFNEVDPIFGTMTDFEKLVNASHQRDIKVILDIVPNHSSDKHQWFLESSRSQRDDNPYSDYYIWHNGTKSENGSNIPPNNWVSVFGGPMWTWHPGRQQYYFHQFAREQPDLNFRNAKVRSEIISVFRFWLGKGVDGFRIDAIRHAFEDEGLRDEELSGNPTTLPNEYDHYEHKFTTNLPENLDLIKSWRLYFDGYKHTTDKEVFMMLEVFDMTGAEHIMPYYHTGADFPFNFNLQAVNRTCNALCIHTLVSNWMERMPHGKWPNWVLGSHDTHRISHKMGHSMVNAMNMLLLTLPGTPITYYGEELGMRNVRVPYNQTVDPAGLNAGQERYELFSRDPCRSPMQWSGDKNGGFSTAESTWLPLHSDYKRNNVEAQLSQQSGMSSVQLYGNLTKLKNFKSIQYGDMDYAVVHKNIFSFIRYTPLNAAYLVTINFGLEKSTDDYMKYNGRFATAGKFVPEKGYVVYNSGNMEYDQLKPMQLVPMRYITLEPGEAVIIRFLPVLS